MALQRRTVQGRIIIHEDGSMHIGYHEEIYDDTDSGTFIHRTNHDTFANPGDAAAVDSAPGLSVAFKAKLKAFQK